MTNGTVAAKLACPPRSGGFRGAAPAAPMVEALECRRLMHGDAGADSAGVAAAEAIGHVRVRFQADAAPLVTGFRVDNGTPFHVRRGSGLAYGWTAANAGGIDALNLAAAAAAPAAEFRSFAHLNDLEWEIAVPNGAYSVRIAAGVNGTPQKINVEGVRAVTGTPALGTARRVTVVVADNELTIRGSKGPEDNAIAFVDLRPVAPPPPAATVTLATVSGAAGEAGPKFGRFRVTRAGDDLAGKLVVNLSVGGTATNGADYGSIGSTVTIPAGQASADLVVRPIDDAAVEPRETITLLLADGDGYTVGPTATGTVSLYSDDAAPDPDPDPDPDPTPAPGPTGTKITWATKAASPVGKAEALRAVVDGKIYVFGGFQPDGPVKRSDVYDPATNAWSRLPDMPEAITHAGVAVVGRNVYVAGGYIGTKANTFAQTFGTTHVWKYNVDSKTWTAFSPLPKALMAGGLVAVGSVLHHFGGDVAPRKLDGTSATPLHYAFDLNNPAAGWVRRADMPHSRNHIGYTAFGGKIYVIAGQFGHDEQLTTTNLVESYDPATNAWTERAASPLRVSHVSSATVVVGNRILILGGETANGKPTNQVSAYNPATNTWQTLTSLPAARFSGVAAAVGDDVYFTTGGTQTTTWKGVFAS